MAAMVIDLDEVRRRRAGQSTRAVAPAPAACALRMATCAVLRSHLDFGYFSGTAASAELTFQRLGAAFFSAAAKHRRRKGGRSAPGR